MPSSVAQRTLRTMEISTDKEAPATTSKMTPMFSQYMEIRNGLPANTLLLFRLGDFYEFFFEDATEASRILGLTLTQRQTVPMAGIPYHAAGNYLQKLLAAGFRVAVCDQLEPSSPGKIVRRALTRIYTPGTIIEEDQMAATTNHYLLAFNVLDCNIVAAWMELSTGQISLADHENIGELLALLSSLNPREILVPENGPRQWKQKNDPWLEAFQLLSTQRLTSEMPSFYFDCQNGLQVVKETLGVLTLDGFDVAEDHGAMGCAGALIAYATQNLCGRPQNIHAIRRVRFDQSLIVDGTTARHLEIFETAHGGRRGSLLDAIDRTQTAAGARLLQDYLNQPLLDQREIERRQDCVAVCVDHGEETTILQIRLAKTRDILRSLGRLQNRLKNPRELASIAATLAQLPAIRAVMALMGPCDHWQTLSAALSDFSTLEDYLRQSLADDLPNDINEGGFIRDGFDEKLDHYRQLLSDNHLWLKELEAEEQQRTGIRNLRVKYNGAFGYFIEVTKSYLHLVPDHYVRRQTTVNAERYITAELREKEREIVAAQQNMLQWEQELFDGVVKHVLTFAAPLRRAAQALAEIDVFVGWGKLARDWTYCRPTIDSSDAIDIEAGRHPVIEQMLDRSSAGLAGDRVFVPNDAHLSSSGRQIVLITGPNMAGKSTYIRQVALITLMAQIGCWIPASHGRIGLVDRIFSRIGASDDLSRGQSTFMVEMHETANILNHATERSLIILDEIGRGTSTYDGLSIAWAIVEHLLGDGSRGPRTFFATHYHELANLENFSDRIQNFHVAVYEKDDDILFLRKVLAGPADRSYGIQVAKLAGIPNSVIGRAKEVLAELEREGQIFKKNLAAPK